MALPSFFRRKAESSPATPKPRARGASDGDEPDLRVRARRRLIGAVVLLGIGVVAFPLLFETEPRPIPVDLPIEIPRPDQVPPLAVPPAEPVAASPSAPVQRTEASSPEPTPQASAAPAPEPAPPPAPTPEPATAQTAPPNDTKAAPPAPEPATAAVAAPRTSDGARAQALLEGRAPAKAAPAPEPAASGDRYVVQVGAYAEAQTVRDVRGKVEALGLKTYTQVVKVAAGERTRVRVGPFDGKAEAQAAADRLKKAGLPVAVLKL